MAEEPNENVETPAVEPAAASRPWDAPSPANGEASPLNEPVAGETPPIVEPVAEGDTPPIDAEEGQEPPEPETDDVIEDDDDDDGEDAESDETPDEPTTGNKPPESITGNPRVDAMLTLSSDGGGEPTGDGERDVFIPGDQTAGGALTPPGARHPGGSSPQSGVPGEVTNPLDPYNVNR